MDKFIIKKVANYWVLLVNHRWDNYAGWFVWSCYDSYTDARKTLKWLQTGGLFSSRANILFTPGHAQWNRYLDKYKDANYG
jgi:hypothetical protein